MNSAKTMTQRDKIAFYIYQNGPQTSAELLKAFPTTNNKYFCNMKYDGILELVGNQYHIALQKRRYFDQCEIQPTYKGQVATSADPALNRKPWTGKYSFANVVRREPIREVSFLNGGIGFNYGYLA